MEIFKNRRVLFVVFVVVCYFHIFLFKESIARKGKVTEESNGSYLSRDRASESPTESSSNTSSPSEIPSGSPSQLHTVRPNTSSSSNSTNISPSNEILINNVSSYALSDVSKILHVPSKSCIEVHLRPNRSCRNPVFKGRISGWSLSMIDFDIFDLKQKLSNNSTTDVVVGTYNLAYMPVSGTYFVEIIHLLCEQYNEDIFRTNLRTVCLEVSNTVIDDHRITCDTASIDIDLNGIVITSMSEQQKDKKSKAMIAGRWLHNSFPANKTDWITYFNITNKVVIPPTPLFTRYQPIRCKHGGDECRSMVDTKQFEEYDFHWNRDYVGYQSNILKKYFLGMTSAYGQQQKETNICFVGASHSRELRNACMIMRENLFAEENEQALTLSKTRGLTCKGVNAHYPKNVTKDWVASELVQAKCTHVVIGLLSKQTTIQH